MLDALRSQHNLQVTARTLPTLKVPPLLFLPLVENAFKHGLHKLENKAGVKAVLSVGKDALSFHIENEMLPPNPLKTKHGGIGLVNIKKRLELYYPGKTNLQLKEVNGLYIVDLNIKAK